MKAAKIDRAATMRERQRSDDREETIAKIHPDETSAKRDDCAIVKRRSRRDDRRDDREATTAKRPKRDERKN